MKGSPEEEMLDQFDLEHGIGSGSGVTLNEWLDLYKNQGLFLVSLTPNPNAKSENCKIGHHIVCANCLKGKDPKFIDTWDSGEMLVDSFMRLKKREPKDSPLHWKYDEKKHEFIV